MARTTTPHPSVSLAMLALLLAMSSCTSATMSSTSAAAPAETADGGTTTPATTTAPPATTSTTAAPTTTATTTTTTTEPPGYWDDLDRVNFLLLGSDAGVGRIGTRTDTIILVSVDPASGDTAMFSVPRNLTEAPLPDDMGVWSCDCFPDIITHLWANGEWYPDAFPGDQAPSVNALKAAMGLTFGVEIHHYAKVELAGFAEVIDALGGVTIDVPKRIVDDQYPHETGGTVRVVIEAGEQHLDGHHALAYSRIRRGSGDFARMHRQRCVIASVMANTDASDVLAAGSELAGAFMDHIETDIPLEALADLMSLISKVDTDRLGSLRITSHKYGASGHAGYQIYDLDQIRADAAALMADPTTQLPAMDAPTLAESCQLSFD
ncbi:MAG: LCP family protein [Acidimicrobiia bacterium]|nr:LCP family protein [Acidimicrobiia bacterium]